MKDKVCPKCNIKNVEEMMYGMMYFEACEAFGGKEEFYGGCSPDDKTRPDYICLSCGYEWK
ncbi:hypothetical protein NE604_01450 [Anaerofustis stercorihominis]|uniref:Uncharacterized protein n=1 Tax=Anaerofustis stercorihominis DSM 17244 TaxID=445971 RepID=B1C7E4_9FIRM|nr:hypothetical protein [Anaerofustis stercorihominis]EDS72931.1 hypothetical protein ANASTE_00646 [Anaerofustis stercorihominis DSM 17244]MCQ4794304.1 hypothetical protein [Anaerofustis stercorihominis]